MEQARDTGAVSLSDHVKLVIDSTPQPRPGFLIFAPGLPARYRAEVRRRSAAPRSKDTFRSRSISTRWSPTCCAIARCRSAFPSGKLARSRLQKPIWANPRGEETLTHPGDGDAEDADPVLAVGPELDVALLAGASGGLGAQGSRPLLALAAGIPISLLLFGIFWSETTMRARATRLARQMTEAVHKQAQLLDLTHDTVILRDHDNVIRYWNRAASDTYGFTSEEAIGRTADELLKTRYPVPFDAVWAELTHNGRWDGELIHTRRDGTEMIVASRWAVQRGADGKIESILETNNDITERRRAEDDRRRLEASLLQAQKLEAMGTLAGGVAHDFNNILGAVLGYGELAQNAAPAGSSLRRYVDSMMSAGQRAKSLVERILGVQSQRRGAAHGRARAVGRQ